MSLNFPKYLEGAGPGRKLLGLLFFVFGFGSILILIGSLVAQAIYGLPVEVLTNIESNSQDADVVAYLKILQAFSSFGLFFLPPLALAFFSGGNVAENLRLNQVPGGFMLVFAVALMIIQIPIINASALWNDHMVFPDFMKGLGEWMRMKEDDAKEITEGFLLMPDIKSLLISLVIVAVMPAIGEELLFRSSVQPLLSKWTGNPHVGIWMTAFLFSFIHFQFFGFIPRFFIGAFLGYLMFWSGNVWYSIAAHFTNNAMQVVAYYLLQNNFIEETPDSLGTTNNIMFQVFISGLLAVSGLYFFYRLAHSKKTMESNLV